MKVIKEAVEPRERIIRQWKEIERAFKYLRDECYVLASICDNTNLKSVANILTLDCNDFGSNLQSIREDILDEYFPINYGDEEDDAKATELYNDSKYNREHAFDENLIESVFSDIVSEPLKGVESPALELDEIDPAMPTNIGVADLLHNLIVDEHEAVQGYNVALANLDDNPEIAAVIKDIAAEEMTHIGQLEQALTTISPNAYNIMNGAVEAERQLNHSKPIDMNYKYTLDADFIDDTF